MKFQIKGFTSLLLTAVFLILGISGIILYLTPRGRVANWIGWTMLGLEKQGWQAVHINLALLFLIVAGLHLYLNWSIFWCYVKKKGSLTLNVKLETFMALLLVGMVLAGTLTRISPFSTLVNVNYQIKDYWDRWASQAPAPHAEELSLNQFADNMGLPASDLKKALQEDGMVVADAGVTIAQLAKANNRTPAEVYAAIKRRFPGLDQGGKAQGNGKGQGKGKG